MLAFASARRFHVTVIKQRCQRRRLHARSLCCLVEGSPERAVIALQRCRASSRSATATRRAVVAC